MDIPAINTILFCLNEHGKKEIHLNVQVSDIGDELSHCKSESHGFMSSRCLRIIIYSTDTGYV